MGPEAGAGTLHLTQWKCIYRKESLSIARHMKVRNMVEFSDSGPYP